MGYDWPQGDATIAMSDVRKGPGGKIAVRYIDPNNQDSDIEWLTPEQAKARYPNGVFCRKGPMDYYLITDKSGH